MTAAEGAARGCAICGGPVEQEHAAAVCTACCRAAAEAISARTRARAALAGAAERAAALRAAAPSYPDAPGQAEEQRAEAAALAPGQARAMAGAGALPPELLRARVRFWACPGHRRGRVEWSAGTARCLEDGCGRTSAGPAGPPQPGA